MLLYTRKATETKQGAFGLKERLLFCLLSSPLPPRELMETLGMAKSNLALLAAKCIESGLIEKSRRADDRRTLVYSLTEKGREQITLRLTEIDTKFDKILTDEKERAAAEENFDKAIELLSYLP